MVKIKYSKRTTPLNLKKSVCVILPRVDINEFLRERKRRSLSGAPSSSGNGASSVPTHHTAQTRNKKKLRVKKEPPCQFHSQVDISDNAVEEIPGVLGEPGNDSYCLHEITRSMCYMCSPHPEDKSEIWNEINHSRPSTSGFHNWHTPTITTRSNDTFSSEQIPSAQVQVPSPTPCVQVPIQTRNHVPSNTPIPTIDLSTQTVDIVSVSEIGVGTDGGLVAPMKDVSTQTIRCFPCKQCPAFFGEVMHLIQHKSVHQKMFECAFCPANFVSKNDLKSHLKLHMLPKYYDCVYCPQAFRKKHDIKSHLSLHADQKQFHCQLCPARFTQKNNLRNHERSHNSVSKFIHVFKKMDDTETNKSECCHSSISTESLSNSVASIADEITVAETFRVSNPEEMAESAVPSEIGKATETPVSPMVLPQGTVSAPIYFYQCQFCPLSFKNYRSFKSHNLCHSRKSGKFICTACGGRFKKRVGLVLHTRYSHTAI